MRNILIFVLAVFGSLAYAGNNQVISLTKDVRDGEEYFYLYGTSAGNYIVKSWQFDFDKKWDGNGEPNLSIGEAIEKVYEHFGKSRQDFGIKEVMLRPSSSKQGSILWFYHVELTTLPYTFGAPTYEVVVLTSGEIVVPYKPKT